MKKQFIVLMLSLFISGPVLAGGNYRSNPETTKKSCSVKDKNCKACALTKGLVFVVKLPFRLVASTAVGLYDLVADQTFQGFVDGYKSI